MTEFNQILVDQSTKDVPTRIYLYTLFLGYIAGAFFLLLCGTAMIVYGLKGSYKYLGSTLIERVSLFTESTIDTTGIVTNKAPVVDNKRGQIISYSYSYLGTQYSGVTVSTDHDLVPVTVRLSIDNPRISMINGDSTFAILISYFVGFAIFIVALVLLFNMLPRKILALRLLREGLIAKAELNTYQMSNLYNNHGNGRDRFLFKCDYSFFVGSCRIRVPVRLTGKSILRTILPHAFVIYHPKHPARAMISFEFPSIVQKYIFPLSAETYDAVLSSKVIS